MEDNLDWAMDDKDFWDHRITSESLKYIDLENALFDDKDVLQLSDYSDKCSPASIVGDYDRKELGFDQCPLSYSTLPHSQSQGAAGVINTNLNQPGSDASNDLLNFRASLDQAYTPEDSDEKLRCWEHGCNGRKFSSRSNFIRHKREKEGKAAKVTCPLCGGIFTRNSARDTHLTNQSCNRIRRYSNGRPRPSRIALLNTLCPSQSPES